MVQINETQCNGINKLGIPAKWVVDNCSIDLSVSNLRGSNLFNTDLRESKLSVSDLSGSNLKNASISKSQKDKIEWVD